MFLDTTEQEGKPRTHAIRLKETHECVTEHLKGNLHFYRAVQSHTDACLSIKSAPRRIAYRRDGADACYHIRLSADFQALSILATFTGAPRLTFRIKVD